MSLLGFGLLVLILGISAVVVALPALGWALVASGAIFAVADMATGPSRATRMR